MSHDVEGGWVKHLVVAAGFVVHPHESLRQLVVKTRDVAYFVVGAQIKPELALRSVRRLPHQRIFL
jgi:hypothetical protein